MSSIFKTLRKHTGLIPVFGITSFALFGATYMSIYSLATKSDVILNKSNNPEPWDRVDPTKPQKLISINQQWKPVEGHEIVKGLMK